MKKMVLFFLLSLTMVSEVNASRKFWGYHDYAVIINGGGDMYQNYERYWNNCSSIYKLLVEEYGYPKDHIFVIMADGTNSANDRTLIGGGYGSSPLDLDGDGTNDINYSATKSNISTVFNTLQNTLTTYDNLVVYTTGPGYRSNGNSYLTLWNNIQMSASELDTELNKVSAHVINILMQQDYSGGFINTLLKSNRTVTSACSATTQAGVLPNATHNAYTYYWVLSASPGDDDDGDDDDDLALENIHQKADDVDDQDSASSFDEGSGVGEDNRIAQATIKGPNKFCYSGVYTSRAIDPLESFFWSTSNGCISIISGQGTDSVTVSKAGNGISILYLTVSKQGTTVTRTANFTIAAGTPSPGSAIEFSTATGFEGCWASNMQNNSFTLLDDVTWACSRIEARLYRLDNNLNPSQLIESWYDISTAGEQHIQGRPPGWYLFELRGINECGYSDWMSQEVEMVDFSVFDFMLNYDASNEILEVTLMEPSSQNVKNSANSLTELYEIQVWGGRSMVKNRKANSTKSQISLTGMSEGVYFVRIVKDGKTYSKKFVKK